MCPVVKELKTHLPLQVKVVVTGQHRQMLRQVLEAFSVTPDIDLDIMQPDQTLSDTVSVMLSKLSAVFKADRPDIVLVHGDTNTAFAAAMSAFYQHIPVAHVEAGLRTFNIDSPFPEEFNRRAISLVAQLHFAPTLQAKENLLREGVNKDHIFVTGNTVIDALRTTVHAQYASPLTNWAAHRRMLLITAHRRENLGEPMHHMFRAIRRVVERYDDVCAIFPIHLNPAVRKIADEELSGCDRIRIIEPLDVLDFHNLIMRAYLVLTDSGGIQEEAPALGKPVIVMRDTTERPEGLKAGTLCLAGTHEESIFAQTCRLLDDKAAYDRMSHSENPYGDGHACERIAQVLLSR